MFDNFALHDTIAFSIAIGAVLIFIVLLCWNGYDDYRRENR